METFYWLASILALLILWQGILADRMIDDHRKEIEDGRIVGEK